MCVCRRYIGLYKEMQWETQYQFSGKKDSGHVAVKRTSSYLHALLFPPVLRQILKKNPNKHIFVKPCVYRWIKLTRSLPLFNNEKVVTTYC